MSATTSSSQQSARSRRRYRLKPKDEVAEARSTRFTMVFLGLLLLALLGSLGVIAASIGS